MNSKVVENCVKTINKAKNLRGLNAFITETFDLASKQAEESHLRHKNKKTLSNLDGCLMSIKDNFCTKSIKTTCGSKMLESYVPPFNATVVQRLFDAGTVLIGKTNLDEFGMGSVSSSYTGVVKNPYNLLKNINITYDEMNDFYTSGGSSGGSAASVSAGLCSFSIGSDTGGSVRNPASICGCIGYKPTYGLISRYGLVPLNNYFDTVGIMAKSVQTIVDVLNVIAGPDQLDVTTIKTRFNRVELKNDLEQKVTIGIPCEFYPEGLSESNLNAWQNALHIFSKSNQVKIVPVSIPSAPYSMSCYSVLTSCEVASNFSRYDGLRFGFHYNLDLSKQIDQQNYNFERVITKNRDESLGKVVKSRIVSGNYFLLKDNYEKFFLKSHQIKQMITNDFQKAFKTKQVDFLLTPTCFHDTQTYTEYLKEEQVFDERDFFTACANIAGLPAISLPIQLNKDKLPVGVQLIGNWNQDHILLNVSNWFIKNNSLFDYSNEIV